MWIEKKSDLRSTLRLSVLSVLLAAVAQGQSYKVLYSFQCAPDGAGPEAGLTRDKAGNLYGTTSIGGSLNCAFGGCGTVFQITPSGVEKVIYMFQGKIAANDGQNPQGTIQFDGAGNMYGTTILGGNTTTCGAEGCGTVYKISPQGKETILHSFSAGTDGLEPVGGLATDHAGHLYGVASAGGAYGGGTLFRMGMDGSQYTILHQFSPTTEGTGPEGNIILDAAGNIYGATQGGTSYLGGTVYKLDSAGNLTVLHTFTGVPDALSPRLSPVRDAHGNLYGETDDGGGGTAPFCGPSPGCGTVYKVDSAGNESVLYAFGGTTDGAVGANGVALDTQGNIYGTTIEGGFTTGACAFDGCGTLFEVTPSGTETVLHQFGTTSGDGTSPFAASLLRVGRTLYGTTSFGGTSGCGTIFEERLP
jgi:uncharacterized repeat protein (TIGR03803 family)